MLWNKIKYSIKTIDGEKEIDYELSLNNLVNFPSMIVIIRTIFDKESKCYPKMFLGECFIWVIKMLPYEKIDISKEIDTNKTSESKECMFWHY